MKPLGVEQRVPGDWYDAPIPANVLIDNGAHIGSAQSFQHYRSRAEIGVHMAAGSASYEGTMFDLGPRAEVKVGRVSMLNGVWLMADGAVTIGEYVLISWNVIIMDTYR